MKFYIPLMFGVLMGGPIAYAATPIPLGFAGDFVILSESGITDVPSSPVVGNVGTSPITGAADHLTCAEVEGLVLSVDTAGPAPCSIPAASFLTTAVTNMQTAYTNAAGRPPDVIGLGGGNIGGLILPPGTYKWSTSVTIPDYVALRGSSTDIWIFQIAGTLDLASAKAVLLQGGARSKNIFWQVAGNVTIETGAFMQGIILSKTLIAMQTGAAIRGRLYAQTAVTLQKNVVVPPEFREP